MRSVDGRTGRARADRWSRELIYEEGRRPAVAAYRDLPRDRQDAPRASRAEAVVVGRSHAAIPVAVVVVGVGLYFGSYSLFVPAALGLLLLVSGVSLLSSRVNPLSPHFYSPRKASWAAVGVVFLGALALLWWAYVLWLRGGAAGLLPHG